MRQIEGILATPRVSRNRNFYFPEELSKGHNVTVPLRWEHIQENDGIIGKSTLFWDEDLMQLRYKAVIDNPEVEAKVEEAELAGKPFRTSLGVSAESHGQICHNSGNCYTVPESIRFREMSVVAEAGIPESTIKFIEKLNENPNILFDETTHYFKLIDDNKTDNTSNECACTKDKVMSEEISQKEDTTVQVKSTEPETPVAPAATAPQPVAPQPQVAPAQTAPAPEVPVAATEAPCPAGCTPPAADAPKPAQESVDFDKLVNDKVTIEIEKLQKQIKETYEPKAVIEESVANALDTEESIDKQASLMEKVLDGQSISIKLDKEAFIKQHTAIINSPFEEAVSISGTISGVELGTQIVILKGGIKVKPIRQWLDVKKIPQGDDTVRFYTLDIPAFADITESASVDITPATSTLTGIDVTANTVRGFRQNVLKSEVERYPKPLLEKIRETARIRSVEDEAANTLITIAASDAVDFGANHFAADDGTLVTSTVDEDAAGEMLGAGIAQAKQYLEEQGHDPENGAAVLALTPRAMKNLTLDPALIRYVQTGDPSISRQGKMSMYFGVELWVTNTIRTANNASRNILFMKGITFGLAVGRDLELEFDKNIRQQSVDIVATHRVNSVILDATAYCILSSVQA
jgi:hypothetical protein